MGLYNRRMTYTKWIIVSTYANRKKAEAMAAEVTDASVFPVKAKSKTRYQVRRLSRQGSKRPE